MRLHRLIIKSSLAVSTVKNLFKPQTQQKKRKKKKFRKTQFKPKFTSIFVEHALVYA
jgi:hypothetical protein